MEMHTFEILFEILSHGLGRSVSNKVIIKKYLKTAAAFRQN